MRIFVGAALRLGLATRECISLKSNCQAWVNGHVSERMCVYVCVFVLAEAFKQHAIYRMCCIFLWVLELQSHQQKTTQKLQKQTANVQNTVKKKKTKYRKGF